MCTTRSDSLPGPQEDEWGSLREGPESLAQQWHDPVGHGERELRESVTFGGNRWGPPQGLGSSDRTLRAGIEDRIPDPLGGAEGKARPASAT